MEKREELYAGKAKSVYRTDDPERFVMVKSPTWQPQRE